MDQQWPASGNAAAVNHIMTVYIGMCGLDFFLVKQIYPLVSGLRGSPMHMYKL